MTTKYIVVFGDPFDNQEAAIEKAEQLSNETGYLFSVDEVEEDEAPPVP